MPASPITLSEVAASVGGERRGEASLTDVTHDSRNAGRGALFVAIRGFTVDGHDFAHQAVERGASALLVEEWLDIEAPQVLVPDARAAMAPAAAIVHGDPGSEMAVIGITGTNGKTTVSYMLEAIAAAAGMRCGRIGTLGAAIDGAEIPVAHTTPESSDLQRLLRRMADADVELVVMEVSSHALALHRAEAVPFRLAAFTNLSQDHLDFHADMDDYFAAKKRLFDGRAEGHVVATADEAGAVLAAELDEAVTVGFADSNDVWADQLDVGLTRSSAMFHLRGGEQTISIRPGGRFNVLNGLVAAACAEVVGVGIGPIGQGLAATGRIPGRLDALDAGQPFSVIVDYAHSPGGVETVVRAAREACDGAVIAVVGSAGDRDIAKRPMMGEAAALADVAVITSDNPRTEDPRTLVDAVVAGTLGSDAEVIAEVDRTAAIQLALDRAQPGDAVLILGKGHEQGQDFGDMVIPYDDREVALAHLRERWAS